MSHKPLRASDAWHHAHYVTPFRLELLCHLSDPSTHPRAPALIPAPMLHLTHVLRRKVLSLTKLKGMNRNPLAITLHTMELSGDGRASEQMTFAKIRELISSTTLPWPVAIPLFRWLWLRPRLTSLLSIGYVIFFPIGFLRERAPVGGRLCHHHQIQPCPRVKVIFG